MSTTLAEAEAHLAVWVAADLVVATGQSYSIGIRSFTRADAKEITEKIKYWENQVSNLTPESAPVGNRGAVFSGFDI